jgi:serine/threonine protein kinase
VVLYELLTGERPFRGNRQMLLLQVLHDEPRPPRQLNDKIPRDLETVCLKALAKSPTRRYATAQELAEDLRRRSGPGLLAEPTGCGVGVVATQWQRVCCSPCRSVRHLDCGSYPACPTTW